MLPDNPVTEPLFLSVDAAGRLGTFKNPQSLNPLRILYSDNKLLLSFEHICGSLLLPNLLRVNQVSYQLDYHSHMS